jgi:hypothetical protein
VSRILIDGGDRGERRGRSGDHDDLNGLAARGEASVEWHPIDLADFIINNY